MDNHPKLKFKPSSHEVVAKVSHPNQSSLPLKLIPLGGAGDVTKNMYVYEYGDDQIAVDCGMGFPKDGALGVDAIIPDISYIEKSNKRFHGIVLTHAHQDHIGGLPYILPRLPKTPVFGSKLAIALAEIKVREFGLTNPMTAVDSTLKLGPFQIDFIHITHSVPNCFHLLIKTPGGTVYHGADFKFDLTPIDNKPSDLAAMAKAGSDGVDLMLTDCLRIEKNGFCPSERTLMTAIDNEVRNTEGRLIFTTMSSSISRFQMVINASAKYHRKIAVIGRSVEQNIKAAAKHGFIEIPKGVFINSRQVKNFQPSQVTVLVSGSQGQIGSAMHRLANDENAQFKLKKGDKVVISSDAIPGNEGDLFDLIDTLYKKGIEVVYSGTKENLHVSGHGYKGDLTLLERLVKPKNIMPIGGNLRHMMLYKDLAKDLNFDPEKVHVSTNGQSLILQNGIVKAGPVIENRNVYVDGLGIGDVGTVVLRDRQVMAEDGILLAIVPINKESSQISGNIEIISRGFVYQKESKSLINEARKVVVSCLKNQKGFATDWTFIRKKIEGSLENFAYKYTERRPLVIALVLEV